MIVLSKSNVISKCNLSQLFEWSQNSSKCIILLIYLALLLDNLLLTSVVPVIPDYLNRLEYKMNSTLSLVSPMFKITVPNSTYYRINNITINYNHGMLMNSGSSFDDQNGDIGLLLSSKAFVQLICNPLVSHVINYFGYGMTQIIGSFVLLLSSILYSIGESFSFLFISRCIQGIASASIAVSGMAMIANMYTKEEERSSVMGFIMGGMAVGILIGYPFGSFTYAFLGKSATFAIIAIAVSFLIICQFLTFNWSNGKIYYINDISFIKLLSDKYILLAIGTISISTTSMSLLESCLPLWLMEKMNPPKWQLGTVFIPDSIGYLIGTNFFSRIAYKKRWLTAMISLSLVGLSAIMIPMATDVNHLIIPHFGLGLGIGITDAVIMPLLAHLVDSNYFTIYGSVYAIAQTAVCLAYSLGPLIGGQLIKFGVPFSTLIRIIGFVNILFCPLCLFMKKLNLNNQNERNEIISNISTNLNTYSTIENNNGSYVPFIDED